MIQIFFSQKQSLKTMFNFHVWCFDHCCYARALFYNQRPEVEWADHLPTWSDTAKRQKKMCRLTRGRPESYIVSNNAEQLTEETWELLHRVGQENKQINMHKHGEESCAEVFTVPCKTHMKWRFRFSHRNAHF